jgi:hypothetical protein
VQSFNPLLLNVDRTLMGRLRYFSSFLKAKLEIFEQLLIERYSEVKIFLFSHFRIVSNFFIFFHDFFLLLYFIFKKKYVVLYEDDDLKDIELFSDVLSEEDVDYIVELRSPVKTNGFFFFFPVFSFLINNM